MKAVRTVLIGVLLVALGLMTSAYLRQHYLGEGSAGAEPGISVMGVAAKEHPFWQSENALQPLDHCSDANAGADCQTLSGTAENAQDQTEIAAAAMDQKISRIMTIFNRVLETALEDTSTDNSGNNSLK